MPIQESTRKTIQNVLLVISITVATVVIVWLIAAFLFLYEACFKVEDVASESSPDGAYTMVLQSVGSPFLFGPTPAHLTLKEGWRTVSEKGVSISDDGSSLHPSNWNVSWDDDSAIITIHGSEQADEKVIMYFDGKIEKLDS